MADQFIYQMTDTWNNGATDFAGIQMDVTDSASLATSRLIDLKVGGASKFKVQKNGDVFLTSTDAGALGPTITAYHNSASPLALDVAFKLLVQGEDSAGNTQDYAEVQVRIDDPTSTSEDASLLFRAAVAGTMTTLATLGGATFTFGTNVALAFTGTGAATTRDNLGIGAANGGYIFGLTVSNNADNAFSDIDVTVGTTAEQGVSNPELMTLASALTKRLDAAWAVGTNQGMRATGAAIADGTYHIFLIKRTDTQVVDIAADTSFTGANIAANTNVAYTKKRRIFSIVRTGGNIRGFVQSGNEVLWKNNSVVDVSAPNPGIGSSSRAVSVPTGFEVEALLRYNVINNGSAGLFDTYLSYGGVSADLPATYRMSTAPVANASGRSREDAGEVRVRTNGSAEIRSGHTYSDANCTLTLTAYGYIDTRGQVA